MATTSIHNRRNKLTPQQTAAIKGELDSLLNSEQFYGTKRCHDFLEFVVSSALAGDYESLVERTLGAEIFGRQIDYDTGSDAIVRVRANDVRRRLTEYYSERNHASEVSISLPAGSYIPEFHWATTEAPAATADVPNTNQPLPVDGPTTEAAATGTHANTAQQVRKRAALFAIISLLALCAFAALFVRKDAPPDRALTQFWQPLVQNHSPVIICMGNAVSFWPSQSVKQAVDEGDQEALVNPGAITETRDDTVTIGNLRAAIGILSALHDYGVTSELRWPQEVQSADLNRSNVIFIGGFNNPWTKNLNRGLRFSFREIHTASKSIWMIQDLRSPNEHWSITKAYPEQIVADYALVTRIIDPDGNRVVISAGGLSQFGTQAAGEFLADENQMKAFAETAPRGWEHRNLQIVLGMGVDGKRIVNPKILATNIW